MCKDIAQALSDNEDDDDARSKLVKRLGKAAGALDSSNVHKIFTSHCSSSKQIVHCKYSYLIMPRRSVAKICTLAQHPHSSIAVGTNVIIITSKT